ncbi:hypothetical protein [Streptomyces tubercidicus]|uniref:hypothetical protein n=1 Tax=Streptomyces tubercidicus TaxID=47759 RepID=UPI00346780CF
MRMMTGDFMAFVEAPGSYFAGESLTIDEILGALEHLAKRELARRVTTEPTTAASVRAKVTESGTDCVLSGGSVSDYLSRRQNVGDTYNFTHSSGIVAGSQNVTPASTTRLFAGQPWPQASPLRVCNGQKPAPGRAVSPAFSVARL